MTTRDRHRPDPPTPSHRTEARNSALPSPRIPHDDAPDAPATTHPGGATPPGSTRHLAHLPSRLRALLKELALVAVLFGVYKAGRALSAGEVSRAIRNAHDLLVLQNDLRLPDQANFQAWAMRSHALITGADTYYAWVHFPATVATLVWLWIRHRDHYRWMRNVLAVLTGLALAVHIAIPMAPPRLMPSYGFVDTAALSGDSPYSGVGKTLANQYAAMPSLHFGWAVVVALAVTRACAHLGGIRRIGVSLIWLHPTATLLVVVITANHYWLDMAAALLLLTAAARAVPQPGDSWKTRLHPARA